MNKTFCCICDNEATYVVEDTQAPLCGSCAEAYEMGGARGNLMPIEDAE